MAFAMTVTFWPAAAPSLRVIRGTPRTCSASDSKESPPTRILTAVRSPVAEADLDDKEVLAVALIRPAPSAIPLGSLEQRLDAAERVWPQAFEGVHFGKKFVGQDA